MDNTMEVYKPFEALTPVELKRLHQFPHLAKTQKAGNKLYWNVPTLTGYEIDYSQPGRSKYVLQSRRSIRKRARRGTMK